MLTEEFRSSPKATTYERVYKSALEMFDYDKDKTISWWMTKNEELDGLAPYEMVKIGKGRKLLKIIERCY